MWTAGWVEHGDKWMMVAILGWWPLNTAPNPWVGTQHFTSQEQSLLALYYFLHKFGGERGGGENRSLHKKTHHFHPPCVKCTQYLCWQLLKRVYKYWTFQITKLNQTRLSTTLDIKLAIPGRGIFRIKFEVLTCQYTLFFGTSSRRSSQSPFKRSTGNDVSGH